MNRSFLFVVLRSILIEFALVLITQEFSAQANVKLGPSESSELFDILHKKYVNRVYKFLIYK